MVGQVREGGRGRSTCTAIATASAAKYEKSSFESASASKSFLTARADGDGAVALGDPSRSSIAWLTCRTMSLHDGESDCCSCSSKRVYVSMASIGADEACAAAKRCGKRERDQAASEPAYEPPTTTHLCSEPSGRGPSCSLYLMRKLRRSSSACAPLR